MHRDHQAAMKFLYFHRKYMDYKKVVENRPKPSANATRDRITLSSETLLKGYGERLKQRIDGSKFSELYGFLFRAAVGVGPFSFGVGVDPKLSENQWNSSRLEISKYIDVAIKDITGNDTKAAEALRLAPHLVGPAASAAE